MEEPGGDEEYPTISRNTAGELCEMRRETL